MRATPFSYDILFCSTVIYTFFFLCDTRALNPVFGVLCGSHWPFSQYRLPYQLESIHFTRFAMAGFAPPSIGARQARGATECSSCFARPQLVKQSAEGRYSARGVPLQALSSSFNPPCSSSLNELIGDRLGSHARTRRFDVVGLGEAMVDYSGMVSAEYLEQIGVERGGRRCVSR